PRQYRREPAKIPPRCAPNLQLRKQLADPRRAAVRLNRDSTGSGVSARSAARQKIPTCAPESATLPGARPDRKSRPGDACARKKRSEEHTSELQSRGHLVCRLLL